MNVSFPNPPADPNKPKKKNKGCLVGCLVVAVLFLISAVVGFFTLKTAFVNWLNNELPEKIDKAVEELQAREQSGEAEDAEVDGE